MPSSAHYTPGMLQVLYTPRIPCDQPESQESKVSSPFLHLETLRSDNFLEAGEISFSSKCQLKLCFL